MTDALDTAGRKWRFYLCNRRGGILAPLVNAKEVKIGMRRNKASTLTFRVPSNEPLIAAIMDDGWPVLTKQRRTVRGFRFEPVDGVMTWKCRYAGIVWQTQDKGDKEGNAWTAVTCMSPMIMLTRIPVVGEVGSTQHLFFDGIDEGEIIVSTIQNLSDI